MRCLFAATLAHISILEIKVKDSQGLVNGLFMLVLVAQMAPIHILMALLTSFL